MKIADHSHFELSSGRRIYANRLIVGLSPRESDIFEGYDGSLPLGAKFTHEEMCEIADYMIELWKKRKEESSK